MVDINLVSNCINEATLITGKELHVMFDQLPKYIQKHVVEWGAKNGMPRDILKQNYDAFASGTGGRSINNADAMMSEVTRAVENYDSYTDTLILLSENIVKAYNESIDLDFNKAVKEYNGIRNAIKGMPKDIAKSLGTKLMGQASASTKLINGFYGIYHGLFTKGQPFKDIPKSEINRYIKEFAYKPSNNPEEIRAIIKTRIAYSNVMITNLNMMLLVNHSLLGYSMDEALAMSERIMSDDHDKKSSAIKELKVKVVANGDKYMTKTRIDLRELGGGIFFMPSEELGLDWFRTLDRMIQPLLKYDAIAMVHGGTENGEWVCQKISTLHGGPFTKVNDLARQLIKEGFKNILLSSCNPGHHELDKDIKDTPGVTITYSRNTLLAENFDPDDPELIGDDLMDAVNEAETVLMQQCHANGIDYNDDRYLDECYEYCTNFINDIESINEDAKSVWDKIVELAKKFIGFIVKIFKGIINTIAGLVAKIKAFFAKANNNKKYKPEFKKAVPAQFAMVDVQAKLLKISAKNWKAIEEAALKSCEQISKAIKKHEEANVANGKEIQQFAEKQSQTITESAYPIARLRNLL